MDYIKELLADLGKRIAEEEMTVRARIDRISEYDDPRVEQEIREEWRQFHLRIKPLQEHREYILKQLAALEAMKPLTPIVIPEGVTLFP